MKKKIAIATLTRGYNSLERYRLLIMRNTKIYENIIKKYDETFDFIIFHEGNIPEEHQEFIKKQTPFIDIIFINVKTQVGKKAFCDEHNKINYNLCPPNPQSNAFPLGYKHMCHFWSIDFLDFLEDYKYVIRIDEDCLVTKFPEKIFDKMDNESIYFLSPHFQGQDEWYVIVGMKKLWENFIIKNGIKPKKHFDEIICPYTNFMIFDLEYIKNNSNIKNMLEMIVQSHGIYSNRWGDLPIWGMILSTLIDEKHYFQDKSISYFHGSHNIIINS